jgi:hypothetical protein
MKRLSTTTALLLAVLGLAGSGAQARQHSKPPPTLVESASIHFEPLDGPRRFGASGPTFGILLKGAGATVALTTPPRRGALLPDRAPRLRGIVRMRLLGSRPGVVPRGVGRLPGTTTDASGADPKAWRTGIPSYSAVLYRAIYPGIDLSYEAAGDLLRIRFLIRPSARPGSIRFSTRGPVRMLRMRAAGRQQRGTGRVRVPARLVRRRGALALRLGRHDSDRPVVVDVVVDVESGRSYGGAAATDVVLDDAGNAYVSGAYWKTWVSESRERWHRTFVASLTKLSPEGTPLFRTYLHGGGALAVAVDPHGAAYLTGAAYLKEFPVTPDAFQREPHEQDGWTDAFVTKIGPRGEVLYSTRLGGGTTDLGRGIDADADGNAYVTGMTTPYHQDTPFPTTPGAFKGPPGPREDGNHDAFVTKIDPTGSRLVYSTYLGGTFFDDGFGIEAAPDGGAVVAGYGGWAECGPDPTCGPDAVPFPTTPGAYQEKVRGVHDAFVARLDSRGSRLIYSTLVGGSGTDGALDLALGPDGTAYVTGYTGPGYGPPFSDDFPTTANAFQPTWRHTAWVGAGFLSAIGSEGTTLEYSSFISNSCWESGESVSLDPAGHVYVAGMTCSADFPTTPDAFQRTPGGGRDGFVLSPELDRPALRYASYVGESADEIAVGMAAGRGQAFVVGSAGQSGHFFYKSPFQDPFAEASSAPLFKQVPIPR